MSLKAEQDVEAWRKRQLTTVLGNIFKKENDDRSPTYKEPPPFLRHFASRDFGVTPTAKRMNLEIENEALEWKKKQNKIREEGEKEKIRNRRGLQRHKFQSRMHASLQTSIARREPHALLKLRKFVELDPLSLEEEDDGYEQLQCTQSAAWDTLHSLMEHQQRSSPGKKRTSTGMTASQQQNYGAEIAELLDQIAQQTEQPDASSILPCPPVVNTTPLTSAAPQLPIVPLAGTNNSGGNHDNSNHSNSEGQPGSATSKSTERRRRIVINPNKDKRPQSAKVNSYRFNKPVNYNRPGSGKVNKKQAAAAAPKKQAVPLCADASVDPLSLSTMVQAEQAAKKDVLSADTQYHAVDPKQTPSPAAQQLMFKRVRGGKVLSGTSTHYKPKAHLSYELVERPEEVRSQLEAFETRLAKMGMLPVTESEAPVLPV
eukprot:TRINITY_DN60255_c0_g1_i1.p2 TRINITY_DN60255_c0_g1~~TRINITY_DN60255_c0_g1_i1.p2  ORF type:complete len:429 (+),score=57.97 TRINITY_DN60255_c0_g1_i1:47-1333(+)